MNQMNVIFNDQLTNVRKMAANYGEASGRIIAVASGKGGVGKSSFALNFALALAQDGKRVTLLDADMRLANIHLLMGQRPRHSLADVVWGDRSFSDITLEDASGLKVISANPGDINLWELEESVRQQFFQAIYHLKNENDYIVIDTAAGLSDTLIEYLLKADEVMVLTTPEPTSVSDSYALVKVLYGIKPGIRIHTLINQVASREEAEEVFERFSLVTAHFLSAKTEYAGYLAEDKHIRQAVQKQKPFYQLFPTSKAARCIQEVVRRVA